MTKIWFLVIMGVSHESGITTIPEPFNTEQECVDAVKSAVPVNTAWKVYGLCVPKSVSK